MTRAVVVGGSVAGCCAARALADAFDEVVASIATPSRPTRASARACRRRHVHALLELRRELDALFPGFTPTMLARGARDLDFGWEFAALREVGWRPRARSPYTALFASRTLLESVVREALRRTPRVVVRERTAVDGLVAGDGGRARAPAPACPTAARRRSTRIAWSTRAAAGRRRRSGSARSASSRPRGDRRPADRGLRDALVLRPRPDSMAGSPDEPPVDPSRATP
ncbi:MAG TPA: hypothetical protein VFD84_00035 [Candidatus Binatia bacterium]|nr:hypothetical protein [Candidatus Binatia bacterium]